MNTIKKMALGLLVAVLAVGFSAYTSASSKFDPQWVYVQTAEDSYEKIPFNSYNAQDCTESSEQPCAFIQDENDSVDHGSSLNRSQLDAIASMQETAEGLYEPL